MKVLFFSQLALSTAVLVSLTACGQILNSVGKSDNNKASTKETKELVNIGINVDENSPTGFAHAAAAFRT